MNIDAFYNWMEDVKNFQFKKSLPKKKLPVRNTQSIINSLQD